MGRKTDLNNLQNNGINQRKRHHQHHRYINRNASGNTSPEANSSEREEENVLDSGSSLGNSNSTVPKTAKLTIKLPVKLKVGITIALVASILVFLMLFVVLFGNSDSGILSAALVYQECSSITVVNTDCDANGNCSNKYSGKVSFEDYIAGVIAAEDNINSNSLEYYKTVAIVTRTELLNLIDSSCEVEGNSSFKEYIPIEESTNKDIIQNAVEETSGKIITKDEMLMSSPSTTACLVNADDTDYYIRFGSQILEDTKIQKVPKEWVLTTTYNELLEDFSTQLSLTEDEFTRDCPEGTNDYGISLVGAYYLIDGVNYNSDEVIKYYYGDDTEVKDASTIIGAGANGFINPVSTIRCTSAFGYRIHPVSGEKSFHSGLDIGLAGGTPIYAANNGTIKKVVNNVTAINNCTYGYGNYIEIDHGDGMSTLYAHIKYGTIPSSIYEGASVTQGEQIGQIGSTGCSTGNHLHYEVIQNKSQIDPTDYMDLTNASGKCKQ